MQSRFEEALARCRQSIVHVQNLRWTCRLLATSAGYCTELNTAHKHKTPLRTPRASTLLGLISKLQATPAVPLSLRFHDREALIATLCRATQESHRVCLYWFCRPHEDLTDFSSCGKWTGEQPPSACEIIMRTFLHLPSLLPNSMEP